MKKKIWRKQKSKRLLIFFDQLQFNPIFSEDKEVDEPRKKDVGKTEKEEADVTREEEERVKLLFFHHK